MTAAPASRRRCAVVGLGSRARLYTQALSGPYADRVDLVGFCDTTAHRMAVHNEWVSAAHAGRWRRAATWSRRSR